MKQNAPRLITPYMLLTQHKEALCCILGSDRVHNFRIVETGESVAGKRMKQDSVVLINGKSQVRKIIPLSEFYEKYVSQLKLP